MLSAVWWAIVGATSLEFRLQPEGPAVSVLPLKRSFFVFLDGRPEGNVSLFLWNATAARGLSLGDPRTEGTGIVWGPIMLARECDPLPGGMPVLLATSGDLVVAAADIAEGVSVTARVSPPQSRPRALQVLNSEGSEVAELCCGTYTLRLEAPDLDVSCEPEEVIFSVISGGQSTSLVLHETGGATGVFTATFRVECFCSSCELSASVAGLVVPVDAEVSFVNEELGSSSTVRLRFTVAALCEGSPVSVVPPFPLVEDKTSSSTSAEGEDKGGEPAWEEGSLPALAVRPTAEAALPGKDFLITLELFLPEGVPDVSLDVEAPPGWGVHLKDVCGGVTPCPIPTPPVSPTRIAVILTIPPAAQGRYPLVFSIPELGKRWKWELQVRDCLEPQDVVRHWDPGTGDIDLASPGEVRFAQLLWATVQVGKRLPYSCRFFTEEDLKALAAKWASED